MSGEPELRHYCRNPKCRSKLTAPADSRRHAFCCTGCHGSFYLRRCIVCERPKPEENRKFCRRPACRTEYRRNPALFEANPRNPALGSQSCKLGSRNPHEMGTEDGCWPQYPGRIVAGPKISVTALHFALIPLDPDTARRIAAANDWDRIKRETAWGRRSRAPTQSDSAPPDWQPCTPSDHATLPDPRIPEFLRRAGGKR